jgi:hypothetical protein
VTFHYAMRRQCETKIAREHPTERQYLFLNFPSIVRGAHLDFFFFAQKPNAFFTRFVLRN